MQPAILSIARETPWAPIRNAVLARAGYSVIPAFTAASALRVLRQRHVSAMIISQCVPDQDCRLLCSEGQRRGVPSVVLDPYEQMGSGRRELHISPLEGPQGFLDALATLIVDSRQVCVKGQHC
jgi:DNA-binding NtrC family response regulator